MKTSSDTKKIKALIDQGFKVVVKDLKGRTFTDRYSIYQNVFFDQLKIVCVEDDGTVTGLQG